MCHPVLGPHYNSQFADGGEDDNIHPRVNHVDQAVKVLPVEVEEAIVTVLDQYPLRPLGATPSQSPISRALFHVRMFRTLQLL